MRAKMSSKGDPSSGISSHYHWVSRRADVMSLETRTTHHANPVLRPLIVATKQQGGERNSTHSSQGL